MKSWLITGVQVLFFVVIAQIADVIVQWLGFPVPGSIVGIGMLFALLKCKIIRLEWIELGSQWLLAEMLLFFIPAFVGIIDYKSLLADHGIAIVVIIAISLLAVMICSGFIGQQLSARKERQVE
ncbi:CidA/LrgA family holin-like protein [Paenibacillus validus]|uniref:CidA/LrgA family holin-like protein n=1 Tax=Paenibacillus validus TaxID=44253 RepID=A0A7X2Z956_9BACL|nr:MULTISPECIES: CidA/LrgA family holin-like protein [Paenibacillus]MED4599800.1 CidA/LrgA family holin-like protein [Paenibacillus validus]MED4604670.1 CidA/LrgA family holin-like protein [Paenibacillus validus]MUG70648.1 CidA/LrgA family holin-like protein [Paenibacillus validus]